MGVEDETGILQQRIEIAPVHREIRQGAGERIRGEQHEGGEAHRDKAEHPEYPRHCIERQATAEEGYRRRPAPRVSTQSSSEPSWAPHTAEMRYCRAAGCWSWWPRTAR